MLNTIRSALTKALTKGSMGSIIPRETPVGSAFIMNRFPTPVGKTDRRYISTTSIPNASFEGFTGPRNWPRYNRKMFPPQEPGEERRKAYVCHMNLNFKYSPDKMWYIACLVRGMSIDEALRQVDYVKRKGAWLVKKTLLEAQELAVRDHAVEFKSNLWVAESFCHKGLVIQGLRRHAKRRFGVIKYKYCHYFVRLEEGPPPENYYNEPKRDAPTLLEQWIAERRQLRIGATI